MRSAPIVVCFPFVGDELGGSHISAVKLIKGLDPGLVTPIVALHIADGPLATFLAEHGVRFVIAPGGAFPDRTLVPVATSALSMTGYILRVARSLSRFLRDRRVDLIHTNDGRIHVAWALPARLAGARQVWHHRGDPDARGVNWLAPLFASQVVAVSRFAGPRKPLLGLQHKLSIVHSPFDPPKETAGKRAARAMLLGALGCPAETRFLGYFGLLIDRKRPSRFVEAVAAFVNRHPEIPVMGLIFGVPGLEAPELDQAVLRRAEELNIGTHIRMMGFQQPVEPWMQAMDALLVPAVREPFGRTLIEAMFLGTPVVATDDGGNREAIENGVTGFLVPPDQPERFVGPVYSMLTDPELRGRIVAAAFDHALATYGVEAHVGEVTRIYQRLVKHQGYPHDKMEQEPFTR